MECAQSDAGEWITEGGRERQLLATDGAFPLQKESMLVLVKRRFFLKIVKLGGNTKRIYSSQRMYTLVFFTSFRIWLRYDCFAFICGRLLSKAPRALLCWFLQFFIKIQFKNCVKVRRVCVYIRK